MLDTKCPYRNSVNAWCWGQECQVWNKCRNENQCPKCGSVCEPNSKVFGFYTCSMHGNFDFQGKVIPRKTLKED